MWRCAWQCARREGNCWDPSRPGHARRFPTSSERPCPVGRGGERPCPSGEDEPPPPPRLWPPLCERPSPLRPLSPGVHRALGPWWPSGGRPGRAESNEFPSPTVSVPIASPRLGSKPLRSLNLRSRGKEKGGISQKHHNLLNSRRKIK